MASERYECVCTTCETSEVVEGLRRAQERFNDHAARGCEVLLRNLDTDASSGPDGDPTSDGPEADSLPVEE